MRSGRVGSGPVGRGLVRYGKVTHIFKFLNSGLDWYGGVRYCIVW